MYEDCLHNTFSMKEYKYASSKDKNDLILKIVDSLEEFPFLEIYVRKLSIPLSLVQHAHQLKNPRDRVINSEWIREYEGFPKMKKAITLYANMDTMRFLHSKYPRFFSLIKISDMLKNPHCCRDMLDLVAHFEGFSKKFTKTQIQTIVDLVARDIGNIRWSIASTDISRDLLSTLLECPKTRSVMMCVRYRFSAKVNVLYYTHGLASTLNVNSSWSQKYVDFSKSPYWSPSNHKYWPIAKRAEIRLLFLIYRRNKKYLCRGVVWRIAKLLC